MQTRPRLVTNVPFWVLVIASLAAVIGGLVLVLRQVDAIQALVNDPNATVVTVYVAQSWVSVGAAVLAAGAIGLASALAVATVVSTRTNPDVAIETIDWTSDDESAAEQIPAFATGTAAPASTTPAAETAAPIAVEDADIETPSTAPAPAQAAPQKDDTDPASR
jgi:uridylate kinase